MSETVNIAWAAEVSKRKQRRFLSSRKHQKRRNQSFLAGDVFFCNIRAIDLADAGNKASHVLLMMMAKPLLIADCERKKSAGVAFPPCPRGVTGYRLKYSVRFPVVEDT